MRMFNKITNLGLLTMLVSIGIMALCVIISLPVPDPVAWVFFAGVIVTIASSFYDGRKKAILE